MSPRKHKLVSADERSTSAADSGSPERLLADYSLAQRCSAGEVAAWEELYSQCHHRMLASIRLLLGDRASDPSLVDEIAARVWYALVDNDGDLLLRYDPKRGATLSTFVRVLAKDMLRRHFRTERRRQARELIAASDRPEHHDPELDRATSTLDEFMTTLSDTDRSFCSERLLGQLAADGTTALTCSKANLWQKTRRMYKRLMKFLGGESPE